MSLRARLTVLAALVLGIALAGAGVVIVGVVQREAQASAVEAVDAALAKRAESIESDAAVPTARFDVGDGIEFGVFRREGPLAFGSMFIDGKEVAIVELNLGTDAVNELLDPVTNRTVTDPDVVAAADRLLIATRTLGGDDGRLLVGAVTPSSVEVSTTAATRALWLILPPIWLVVVFVTWLMVGRALKPVESVTRQARLISTDNLHQRVPVPRGSDELARLATTINELLARLERGDARQRQFSADVSHELRNPLAALRAAADVIVVHPDQAAVMAPEIVAGADRIDRIIDDLLALGVLDAGRSSASPEVDLTAVAGDVVGALPPSAVPKVELIAAMSVNVRGNETQLRRVVDNLVTNAVRHATGVVTVAVNSVGDAAHIVVEDDGPGVPDEMADAIFDRFVRLDESRSRDDGGVGLGLSLVKAIVDAHGGTIELSRSASLGGARFSIAMPTFAN